MDIDESPPRLQASDLDVSNASYDSRPREPTTFHDLLHHFEEVEEQYHLPSLTEWRFGMNHLRRSTNIRASLNAVLSLFHVLEDKVGSHAFDKPNELLLEGSRYDRWRYLYGDTGLLDFYLDYLNRHCVADQWDEDILSLIANTCVGYDQNREKVLAKFDLAILINAFSNEDREWLAIPALLSICCDYEPALQAARSRKLFAQIIAMFDRWLHDGRPSSWDRFGEACALLDFAIEEFDANDLPENAFLVIWKVLKAKRQGIDNFGYLCNALCALLERERFQKLLVAKDEVELLMAVVHDSYTLYLEDAAIDTGSRLPHLGPQQESQILKIRDIISQRFWDVSQLADFRAKYHPQSDIVDKLCIWLSVPQTHLQICACNVLRSITSSEQASIDFLRVFSTPQPAWMSGSLFDPHNMEESFQVQNAQTKLRIQYLLDLLRMQTNSQVTEEGLRLLRNLAIPQVNKTILTDGQPTMALVMFLCSNEFSLPVRYAALVALRQLLTDEILNVRRFILGAPPENNTRQHHFLNLISLFETNNGLPVRMEVALIIVMIWRVAYSKDHGNFGAFITDTPIEQARESNCNIAVPMFALIKESGNASLVTQGWFGLVLMANSPMGVDTIFDFVCANAAMFQGFIRALEPGSSDQNNAMILCENLIVRYAKAEQPDKVKQLEDLFQGLR